MYHSIEEETKDCSNIYTLNLNFFREQLDLILNDLEIDIVPFKESHNVNNIVSITFDDGYKIIFIAQLWSN